MRVETEAVKRFFGYNMFLNLQNSYNPKFIIQPLFLVVMFHFLLFFFVGKFHKVLFLAPGGRTVFLGSVPEAENYFEMLGFQIPEKVNPADFYMDVIGGLCKGSDESTSTLPERWEQYAAGNNAGAENTDCADGSRAGPDDGIEQLSFKSTLKLFKRNPNKGTQWFPKVLKVCSPRSMIIDINRCLSVSLYANICRSIRSRQSQLEISHLKLFLLSKILRIRNDILRSMLLPLNGEFTSELSWLQLLIACIKEGSKQKRTNTWNEN